VKSKLYWRKVGITPEDDDYDLFYVNGSEKEVLADIEEKLDRYGDLIGYEITWPFMELTGQFTSVYETVGSIDEAMKIGKEKTIIFLKKFRGVSI
jgi:hypothetical protein